MAVTIQPSSKKLYFGALDSLRTYAFFIVFISHAYFSFFETSYSLTRIFAHGEIGVHIFFVLSAFLITYLSLREYRNTRSFSVVHFFKKRILRIWPLYFLIIGLSYLWHSMRGADQDWGCLTQYLYFFGNFCAQVDAPDIIGSTTIIPLWSISVEQQFYTVFPLVLIGAIWLNRKMSKSSMYLLGWGTLGIVLAYALHFRYIFSQNWEYISYTTVASLPGFIFGIVLAYIMHKNSSIVEHVRSHKKVYAISALISFASAFAIKFSGAIGVSLYILPIIYSTLIYIILATGKEQAEKKTVTQYLGQISYGLYVYHMFAIVFMQFLNLNVSPFIESFFAFLITVILAHASFKYFESYFLRFK